LRDGAVDGGATRARRLQIRTERLGGHSPKAEPQAVTSIAAVCPGIDKGRFRCLCGTDLGPANEDWKSRSHQSVVTPQACGPHLTLHAELELREFICRECGTLLEVEVARHDQKPLQTIRMDA
jgi:N-methylhydantoinase B